MGSASSQTALRFTNEERRAGQQWLKERSAEYPTLAAQGYLHDDDWDGSFTNGLQYLLDGLEMQLPPRSHRA